MNETQSTFVNEIGPLSSPLIILSHTGGQCVVFICFVDISASHLNPG